jgi:Bax inhibitor 1
MIRRISVPFRPAFHSVGAAQRMCFSQRFLGLSSRSSSAALTTSSSSSMSIVPSATASALRPFHSTPLVAARGAGHSTSTTSSSSSYVEQRNVPQSWGGSSGNESTAESLTPNVRRHLARVYTLLGAGCLACGFGSAAMFLTPLGKMIPYWLPMIAGFVPLLWLSFRPPQNPQLKLGLYFAFTILEGMAIAPIVKATMVKGVLGSAVVMTAAVFGGFSAAAYLAPRASLLALQGPLYGLLMGMFAISLLNMFYPTAFAHSIILYGGLALFSVMISADTQAMIERARCGAGDHVQDAVQMFLNVINIFVRLAAILRGD